jgi:hypothetical protein
LDVSASSAVYRVAVLGLTALAVLGPLSLFFYQSLLTCRGRGAATPRLHPRWRRSTSR